MMENLEGVYVALVTPFTQDGDVNYAGLQENVDWLIKQGVHGLIPLGSTGEFASLEDEQKRRVMQTVIQAARGKVSVIVGASAETTQKAVFYAKQAEEFGADGVLILPPWYYTPNCEEIFNHYARIAESIKIPIMIYNNPISSKVDVKPEIVARLAKLPNITSIKESSGDIRRITLIRILTDERLTIFCGWEDMAYESFIMGARGWVCVIGNVAPQLAVQLYELTVVQKDYDAAWKLYKRMLPFLRYLEYSGKTHKALKYLLDKMGLCGGYCSSPKLPLSDVEKAEVEKLFNQLSIT
jgi:4-hydroxy-tetrahydrodipicolinate synthase